MNPQFPYESIQEVALRLQAIIETAIDGIILIDAFGIVESINPAAATLFGYAEQEVIGKNISMLMPSPYNEQHDDYIDRYKKTGKAKIIGIGREVSGLRKDGTIFPMRLAVSEVQLENRIVFTGIIHDLSAVKQAHEKIHRLNEELESKVITRTEELASVVNKLLNTNKRLQYEVQERIAAEEALRKSEEEVRIALENEKELSELKSRFVSMASHEFRTPLSTILSSVSLIGRYTTTEQQDKREKHINRIKSAVQNLTGILNDFLSLSRLEEGKVSNKPTAFDLQLFCTEIIEELQGVLKPGQKIIKDFPKEAIQVFLDERLLKNVLFNLLSNAIKYSGEDRPIYFEITQELPNTLCLCIKDEGIGIPEKDIPHLFSRFFRATNATNIQGTGLGLNIVKRYVELMKGKIRFESQEGKGSSFWIDLPLRHTPID